MGVYLDDREVDLHGETLSQVLESARLHLQADGRVVVEVQLDGQSMAGEQLVREAPSRLADGAELRLYSAAPNDVARAALEQVRQHLLDQQAALARAADQLQQDQANAAFQLLGQINNVWLTTMQTIEQAAAMLETDLGTLTIEGKLFAEYTGELLAQLQELRRQVQDQDTAALADSLAHEWPNAIEQWDAVIGALTKLKRTEE